MGATIFQTLDASRGLLKSVKVALVTGPCLPGSCGVGDYTSCLSKVLNVVGVESRVIDCGNWSLRGALRAAKTLERLGFDIVHIQYPTAGFGTDLGPQVLSLLQGCVVTIHEASQRHILRQLSLFPLTVRSKHVIFTSEKEQQFVGLWAPWVLSRSSVIPVGSNIPVGRAKRTRKLDEIVYFGLILPGKGLEDVVDLGELIRFANLRLTVRIVGQVPTGHAEYYQTLRRRTDSLPITWSLGLRDDEVAELLAGSSIAYLPYPDGCSERRTTLKAALQNGVVVISTRGMHTPGELEGVVKFCHTPQEALHVIRELTTDTTELSRLSALGAHLGYEQSWQQIAEKHLAIYKSLSEELTIHT